MNLLRRILVLEQSAPPGAGTGRNKQSKAKVHNGLCRGHSRASLLSLRKSEHSMLAEPCCRAGFLSGEMLHGLRSAIIMLIRLLIAPTYYTSRPTLFNGLACLHKLFQGAILGLRNWISMSATVRQSLTAASLTPTKELSLQLNPNLGVRSTWSQIPSHAFSSPPSCAFRTPVQS